MTPIERIWSYEYLILLERQIWIQVMDYHERFDLVTKAQLRQSIQYASQINLERIEERKPCSSTTSRPG